MTPSAGTVPSSALSTEAAICVPTRAWVRARVRGRVRVRARGKVGVRVRVRARARARARARVRLSAEEAICAPGLRTWRRRCAVSRRSWASATAG